MKSTSKQLNLKILDNALTKCEVHEYELGEYGSNEGGEGERALLCRRLGRKLE